jgi:hypothetical protein
MANKRKPLGTPAEVKKPVGKPRGRNGGRPPSAATRRSKEIADKIAEGQRYILEGGEELPKDATPLDVMLAAMRCAYNRAGPEAAAVYAKDAAPYLHARIAQMILKGDPVAPVQLMFTWAGEEKPDTDGI